MRMLVRTICNRAPLIVHGSLQPCFVAIDLYLSSCSLNSRILCCRSYVPSHAEHQRVSDTSEWIPAAILSGRKICAAGLNGGESILNTTLHSRGRGVDGGRQSREVAPVGRGDFHLLHRSGR